MCLSVSTCSISEVLVKERICVRIFLCRHRRSRVSRDPTDDSEPYRKARFELCRFSAYRALPLRLLFERRASARSGCHEYSLRDPPKRVASSATIGRTNPNRFSSLLWINATCDFTDTPQKLSDGVERYLVATKSWVWPRLRLTGRIGPRAELNRFWCIASLTSRGAIRPNPDWSWRWSGASTGQTRAKVTPSRVFRGCRSSALFGKSAKKDFNVVFDGGRHVARGPDGLVLLQGLLIEKLFILLVSKTAHSASQSEPDSRSAKSCIRRSRPYPVRRGPREHRTTV
jgi:hypothetical protein